MKPVVFLFACLFITTASEAASRTVCASGCQYSSIQAAIDAAAPGDVILLRAGQTFMENVILRAKSSTSTADITIRSDASDSYLPAPGGRLIPEGNPGANTARSLLARVIGQTGTYRASPVIRAELGAHHYRLQFLDIDGSNSEGYYTLIELGQNSSSQTLSNAPHHIVFDRVYAHGHPAVGMQRGIVLNGRDLQVVNSYFSDFFSIDESQAIAGFNGAGPFLIENNYLEAAAENIMFGGADPRTVNLVPSDIVIRRNHITKRTAWKNAALAAPASPAASAAAGGYLPAGTHYFKVVARLMSGGNELVSAPSVEVSTSLSATGSVRLSWNAVSNVAGYRIFRGTAAGAENRYMEASGTSLTYTGSGEAWGTPPTTGTFWTVKNLLELKNAQRVTIDGNVFENIWRAAQNGYALVFTPRNQEGTAPWSVVRDVQVINNVVQRAAGGLNILGHDDVNPSEWSVNLTIANNLFLDISTGYGGDGLFATITSSPTNVSFDHNTIVHDGSIILADDGAINGFRYTNNFSKHNTYGILGSGSGVGIAAMPAYFPSGVITKNVLAGGQASQYPSGNYFPTVSVFNASFVDAASGNYTLISSSPYRNAGSDGKDIGVSPSVVTNASTVVGGNASGGAADGGSGGEADPGTPSPSPVLPSGWLDEDIGVVGVSGASAESGGAFTVKGAGGDVWGTADAFHFTYQVLAGDATIIARVSGLIGTESWAKVGVMIRGSLSPTSPHAFMLVSKAKGLAFQRRRWDSEISLHTPVTGSAPAWVKLTRVGNVISAFASSNGTSWILVGSETVNLPTDVLVGLAVTSHSTAAAATGTFDNVSVVSSSSAEGLDGWTSQDIGSVGTPGNATASGGTLTVAGAGADIWGTVDAFHYVYRTLPADGSIVARVATFTGADEWTKVGVMMRQTLDAGSAQAMMLLSWGNGVAFQRRPITGGITTHTSGGAGGAPSWVKLTRSGAEVWAYTSADGANWRYIGADTMSFSGEIYVGLAVTSHVAGTLATGVFDGIQVLEQ